MHRTIFEPVARPLISGMFVLGGIDALRHPENKVEKAEFVTSKVRSATGISSETENLIKLNGASQVLGGTLLVFGKAPRAAASMLSVSLAATTLAGHRFWEMQGEEREAQEVQFFKNLSMLGGLIALATTPNKRHQKHKRAAKRDHRSPRQLLTSHHDHHEAAEAA